MSLPKGGFLWLWTLDCSFPPHKENLPVAEPRKGDWHWVAACRQGPLETAPPWPEHDIWLMLVQSQSLQHQIVSSVSYRPQAAPLGSMNPNQILAICCLRSSHKTNNPKLPRKADVLIRETLGGSSEYDAFNNCRDVEKQINYMMKVYQAAEPRYVISKTGTRTEILPPGLGISSDCLSR